MKRLSATRVSWQPPDQATPVMAVADFAISSGEVVAVVGPSGAGKSTFLRTLAYLLLPTTGVVTVDGVAVSPETILAHRRRVAYIAQKPTAIARTIAENLALARQFGGPDAANLDAQMQELASLGLDADEHWLQREFTNLSGGEQQRVALVRSLTSRPEILLLDEPTTGLDEASTRRVEDEVRRYLDADAGRAAVWVSHDRAQLERIGARCFDVERP